MSEENAVVYDCSTDFLHHFRNDVRDPLHPKFVCTNCGLWINAESFSALTAFFTEVQLFNYGIALYGGFIHRDIAFDVLDAGIEIALLKLPVKQLDNLKEVFKGSSTTYVNEELSVYKFKDRQGVERDLSIFHWHVWRVVEKLLERDGFSPHEQEKEKEEVQQQQENGVGLCSV